MKFTRASAAVLLVGLCLAGAAGAATINVPADYATIQAAVDAASTGDVIQIATGTYTEQVQISQPLTLVGAGVGATIIKSPATLPLYYLVGSYQNHPVVYIHDTDGVLLSQLTVDGDLQGNANFRFQGVGFWKASGSMTDCSVLRIQDNPLSGAQHGVGIYGNNNDVGTEAITLTNVVVEQFQKGALVFSGVGLTATLTNVSALGIGPTSVTAQNCIQIGYGASGSLTDCVLGNVEYTGTGWASTGALFFESADVTVDGGEISGCQTGLSHAQYGWGYISPVAPQVILRGVRGHDNLWNAYGELAAPGSCLDLTVTGCDFHDNLYTGLGIYGDAYYPGYYAGWSNGTVNSTITGNRIVDNGYGLEVWTGVPGDLTTAINCLVRGNDFSGNTEYGAYNNFPTRPLNAVLNWWGTSEGPTFAMPKAAGVLPPSVSPMTEKELLPKAAAATIASDSMTADKATGVNVSPYVDYTPWLTGNVACVPEPRNLSAASPTGAVAVRYLGGGSAPLYGYSIDVLWDPAVATATVARPDDGPFHDTPIFFMTTINSGGLTGYRVDATLTGAATGILYGDLFKLNFNKVAVGYSTGPIDLTLVSMRNNLNADLTGVAADDGLVVVDGTAPVIAAVAIANATLTHTDDYIKNTDHAVVTATVTDDDPAFGLANIRADLSGLGGAASAAPVSYVAGVATWDVPGATCTPTDGTVTVYVTAVDPLGNAAAPGSDDIESDNTPPAALAGLTAAPGHQKVTLGWNNAFSSNPREYRGTLIRYTRWTGYPVYTAAEPLYPNGPTAGDGTAFDALGSVADATHNRPAADDRDIYYYSGFVYDEALNFSPPAPTPDARATCYWLGDVCGTSLNDKAYNGKVDIADVTVLAAAYGMAPLAAPYDETDVGPTHDRSRLGIPLPDGIVNFEDLMIFAMNFSIVSRAVPATGGLPVLAWARLDETTWALTLEYGCPALQGIRLSGDLPAGAVAQVVPGALVADQHAPYFLKNARGLDVGFAMLGTNAGVVGSGELLRVTLPAGVSPANVTIEARGVNNQDLGTTAGSSDDTSVPRVFALAQNVPNPFNPMTKISFSLPVDQTVRLRVFGVDGRLVRTLVDGRLTAGSHDAIWDGRTDSGRLVASGTYFCRIEAGENVQTRKMSLMK